ncbi:NhaA family Na+:H+ antiporter [Kutzneria buriramensis]|uniref:Na(+)/H(+) antiporter NhaA n=1 Tax=Kutzneria buriramensis TaxID=1045776 RepID=A0A3E0HUF6_9PSEU|nr:Na+/H+ antiporter NhaA [Kutzneria buriramensis]REH50173.1 NhaA family Na+:H+ antiporter [Kutzneria buriramensis]
MTRYLRTETVGGLLLLAATAVALLWANSPLADSYHALRELTVGPLALDAWAEDGLLALFFFVAGLELKRELVVGELADRRAAVLPVVAALGGMVVPALLALAIGGGQAWTIPVATDIAFALAVLAITGSGLPATARVFLLSLAVVDDLGAIAVIAVAFSTTINLVALGAAVALLAGYWFLQRRRVRSPWLYVPIAAATWFAVHEAGLHATIAGVALGLLTRVTADPGEAEAPAIRLEHRLQPWSAGVAVPMFALFAAGVPIGADSLHAIVTDTVAIAVVVGLVIGKIVGVLGASALAVTTGLASKPRGLGWRDMAAVATLGGVGFTVSLLMAELALAGDAAERAKAAVLLASAAASLLGAALLLRRSRVHRTANT